MSTQAMLAAVARKRAGGGPPPFVPTDIAGCLLWLDAAQIVGLSDNDPVDTWSDLSGQANDATGVLTTRPLYKTNIINSKPIVRFDGVDDFLITIDTVTPRTIFFLGQLVALPGGNKGFLGGGAFTIFPYYNASGAVNLFAGADLVGSSTVAATAPFIGTFVINGASSSVQVNSITATTGDAGSGGAVIIKVGGEAGSLGNIDALQFVVYDSVLSGGDIASVKAYLATQGGI